MKISTKVRIQNTIKFIVQKDEIHEIQGIDNERQQLIFTAVVSISLRKRNEFTILLRYSGRII
ncbi:hypothetical protein MKC48_10455 [[Clostridium] innocuum]|nr:hypothetical protein [[Clostridium] innocuum]